MWKNQVVFITGGSSGIGLALATALARRGARLGLIARDRDKLESARKEVAAAGGAAAQVAVRSLDVTDPAAAVRAVAELSVELGPPTVLINSAGILSGAYFEDQSLERFHLEMETNFFGGLNLIKAALPDLKRADHGRVINIASIAGAMGVFGYATYCSSKFALVGLSETLRAEFKPQGVSVHLALPPETDTPMLRAVLKTRPPELTALVGINRTLSADQVAKAVIRGVEKGRFLIIPGFNTKFLYWLSRLAPPLARAINDLVVMQNYRGPDAAPGRATRRHICPWWLAYGFDNPLRRLIHDPNKIFGPYLKEGMTALDLGCGMGYYSLALARMVGPAGRVIAADLQPQMLAIVRQRARRAGLAARVQLARCRPNDLNVTERVDFAVASWMVHEVPDQDRLLAQVRDLLKPGGAFLIVEPRGHVKAAAFQKTLDLAARLGLNVAARPHVGISHAALLKAV